MAELKKFNPENCDIRTQLMFEDWATIPMLRIMTFVLARKGKSVFSCRGIAEIIDIPKSTVFEALKVLVSNGYLLKVGDRYNLILSVDVQPTGQVEPEVSSPPDAMSGQSDSLSSPPDESVQPTGPNNNKIIIKKNNDKRISAWFDQSVQEDIGTGRKPLRKYPEIWITPDELEEVLESLTRSNLPQDRWKEVFLKVRTFARDQAGESKNFKRVRCVSALMGWAKKEVVSEFNEATKLHRNLHPVKNEASRSQPKQWEPPEDLPDVTPEQREINKKLVEGLVGRTTKAVAA